MDTKIDYGILSIVAIVAIVALVTLVIGYEAGRASVVMPMERTVGEVAVGDVDSGDIAGQAISFDNIQQDANAKSLTIKDTYIVSMYAGSNGPMVNFGSANDHDAFMKIGAYDGVNNIDNMGRRLKIKNGEVRVEDTVWAKNIRLDLYESISSVGSCSQSELGKIVYVYGIGLYLCNNGWEKLN